MNILQLRETLRNAEQAYAKAETGLDSPFGLDNSKELILAKEALKTARFDYAEAAMDYVEEMIEGGELKWVL